MMRSILYPTADILRGTKFVSSYRFLMKSQWWDEDKITDLQNEKIRKLINHAYHSVPYYHKLFKENNLKPDDIKDRHDLKKIPPLTKSVLRKYGTNELLSIDIPDRRKKLGRTGGSTGEPLRFYKIKRIQ